MNFSLKALVLPIAFIVSCLTFAQNTISGTVLDEEGNALYGASVVLKGTSDGIVADENGNFSLQTNAQLPIEVEISFVGFETLTYSYSSFDAQTFRLNFGNRFDEIIVSASRKAEKLQEAPAAVSVLSAAQVSKSGGSISPIRALINTPGVELQQQTGQRIKVSLRGASGIFSTNVFPMLDYRSLISPGLEFFDSQNSPLHTIDLERVEVVLGPGSALYGPDVTTGVIHFISKDPFKHPGTTVELIYGSRANKKIGIRHARKNDNETIGYKFNFRYQEGRDFTLDPNDAQDKTILDGFKTAIKRANITPEGNTDTRSSGTTLFTVPQLQNEDFWTSTTSAYFYFRPKNGPEIVTSGGWNAGNAIYYNDLGEGQSQSNE
jgi:outer membrane receptor for ferrienterochelin and colicins